MTGHRYPLQALIQASGLSYDHARQQVGASGSSWTTAARDGLSELVADRWAVKLGQLALVVWPEMVDHQIADLERSCAAPDCPARFIPPVTGRGQKERHYCSRRCQVRTNKRRQRLNPEQRARDNACRSRYGFEIRAAARARRSQRDASA